MRALRRKTAQRPGQRPARALRADGSHIARWPAAGAVAAASHRGVAAGQPAGRGGTPAAARGAAAPPPLRRWLRRLRGRALPAGSRSRARRWRPAGDRCACVRAGRAAAAAAGGARPRAHLAARQDLAVGLLDTAELPQEVPARTTAGGGERRAVRRGAAGARQASAAGQRRADRARRGRPPPPAPLARCRRDARPRPRRRRRRGAGRQRRRRPRSVCPAPRPRPRRRARAHPAPSSIAGGRHAPELALGLDLVLGPHLHAVDGGIGLRLGRQVPPHHLVLVELELRGAQGGARGARAGDASAPEAAAARWRRAGGSGARAMGGPLSASCWRGGGAAAAAARLALHHGCCVAAKRRGPARGRPALRERGERAKPRRARSLSQLRPPRPPRPPQSRCGES